MTNRRLRMTVGPAVVLLLALLSFAAFACGGDNDGGEAKATSPRATSTGGAATAATGEANGSEAGQTPATEAGPTTPEGEVTATEGLEAELPGTGGVSATATLRPVTAGTEVVLEVRGLAGTHTAYLHHGTCEQLGESDVTVGELSPGADGGARATVVIPPPDEATTPSPGTPQAISSVHFFQIDHVVVVHAGSVNAPGAVVACGPLQ